MTNMNPLDEILKIEPLENGFEITNYKYLGQCPDPQKIRTWRLIDEPPEKILSSLTITIEGNDKPPQTQTINKTQNHTTNIYANKGSVMRIIILPVYVESPTK